MIRPYKRPPGHREVGWLCANGSTVIRDDGRRRHIDHLPKGTLIFAERDVMVREAQTGKGEVTFWKTRPVRWDVRGRTVLPVLEPPETDEDAAAGLFTYAGWIEAEGARVGTFGSTAMSLLRATISRPLYLGGTEAPPLREVVGGRQLSMVGIGRYRARCYDLRGAYANAIGHLTYGGRWVEVPGGMRDDPGCLVFSHARVRIPPMSLGPLPRRMKTDLHGFDLARAYPTGTTVQGIWAWDELRNAYDAGATVRMDRSWVNPSEAQPFLPWWEATERGRDLGGFAGTLAKRTAARLWGLFATSGQRVRVHYRPGHAPTEDRLPPIPGFNRDLALAEAVCMSVRNRLWREAVVPYRARLIGGHTDSVMLAGEDEAELPADWRLKWGPANVRWMGPQLYAWMNGRTWSYSAAGVPGDPGQEFDDLWHSVMQTHAAPLRYASATLAAFKLVKDILGAEPPVVPDWGRWNWDVG